MVADLFHVGHINLLKEAKKIGNHIIVGIHADKDVESYKRTPIINQKHRYEMLRSCKHVNEIIEAAPLIITEEFLELHKIDFVVHGNDISDSLREQHKVPEKKGMVRYVQYTAGISTSEIIEKIQNRI